MSSQAKNVKQNIILFLMAVIKKKTNVNAFIGTVKKLVMKMVKGTLIKV